MVLELTEFEADIVRLCLATTWSRTDVLSKDEEAAAAEIYEKLSGSE